MGYNQDDQDEDEEEREPGSEEDGQLLVEARRVVEDVADLNADRGKHLPLLPFDTAQLWRLDYLDLWGWLLRDAGPVPVVERLLNLS